MSRAILAFALSSAALTAPLVAAAQAADSPALRAHLDAAARAFTAGHAFMGAVLVDADGHRLLDKGYGFANVEARIPSAPDIKYRIGSLTKQFTAAAILLLQQDGKLSTSDPVSRYLPDTPPAWQSITLAELLGHTSGIPDLTHDPDFPVWAQKPRTWPEVLARFRDRPLDFQPGAQFEYSSSNYELLGKIIETVSGKPYGDFLRERIFDPLGMRDTGLDRDGLLLRRRAQGYVSRRDGALEKAAYGSLSVPWSAGAIYSTSKDLLRWEQGLFGGRLLSAASLQQMTTPGLGGYGMGVFVGAIDGLKVIEHGGAIEGFHSFLIHAPQRRLTVVVLSSANWQVPVPDRLANGLLEIVLGQPNVLPPISARELDRYAGAFALPTFSLTFRRDGDRLDSISDGEADPTVYEGLDRQGAPSFYVPRVDAEITFKPDAAGAVTSLVLHQNGKDTPGVRR
ncbi:MAG TPA: serine hydrolase [Caulobacteraceae bacterium]|nr:serine hydrolase [Caulobacteraceae bacterium]